MEISKTPFEEGVDAFERGKERADCPYAGNDDRRSFWIEGWEKARRADELLVDGLP